VLLGFFLHFLCQIPVRPGLVLVSFGKSVVVQNSWWLNRVPCFLLARPRYWCIEELIVYDVPRYYLKFCQCHVIWFWCLLTSVCHLCATKNNYVPSSGWHLCCILSCCCICTDSMLLCVQPLSRGQLTFVIVDFHYSWKRNCLSNDLLNFFYEIFVKIFVFEQYT